jgi:hypothetical protein
MMLSDRPPDPLARLSGRAARIFIRRASGQAASQLLLEGTRLEAAPRRCWFPSDCREPAWRSVLAGAEVGGEVVADVKKVSSSRDDPDRRSLKPYLGARTR